MPVDKIIPQHLNKDGDYRIVSPHEMVDALNVRVSHDGDGDGGVIKNTKGTSQIVARNTADTVPASGTNRVIGAVSSEAGKCIYYFLYNSDGDHGIYQYLHTTNSYYKVYENSVLNFSALDYVDADVVINQFGEHLLYFTDNRNEPRKINATKALTGQYVGTINTGTTAQKELFLTVCKQPPQDPPTFVFDSIPDGKPNLIKENIFQFAYQYVYDDGEVSALSPYSELSVSDTNLAFDAPTKRITSEINNAIILTLNNSDGPVTDLRVFMRKGGDSTFYRIAEVSNGSVDTQNLTFRNDGVYNVLNPEQVNKNFDAVPRLAFSQTVTNNRLMYGDYLEGFDNLGKSGFNVDNYPIYHHRPNIFDIIVEGGDVEGAFTDNSSIVQRYAYMFGLYYNRVNIPSSFENIVATWQADAQPSFKLDLSDIPNVRIEASTITVSASLDASEFGIGSFGNDDNVFFSFNVTTYDDNGDEILSKDCRFLTPQDAAYPEITENLNNFLANISGESIGSIGRLAPQSSVVFETTFTIGAVDPGETTVAEQLGQLIIDNMVNQVAFVPVRPKALDGNSNLYRDGQFISGGSNATTKVFAADGSGDSITLWMEGVFMFKVFEGYTFTDTDGKLKIDFNVKLSDVELDAFKAVAIPTTTTVPGATAGFNGGSNFYGGTITSPIFDGEAVSCTVDSDTLNQTGDFTLKDNTTYIETAWRNFSVSNSFVRIVPSADTISTSFKAAATHPVGLLYFDHRSRHGGVQPTESVEVTPFGGDDRYGRDGRTEIDMRIKHSPPYWAKKWAPVYANNTTYEDIITISVSEAALAKKTTYEDPLSANTGNTARPILESLDGGSQGVILLSMRALEGKNNSYKELKGADVKYEYAEGDILTVLEYIDGDGTLVRPSHEFRITGYKFFRDDENNPVSLTSTSGQDDEDNYRRTGWFLILRDDNISGFNRTDIAAGTDFFSQRCIAEISRPKRNTENTVYYEIGKMYDVVDTGGGLLAHEGDRSNTVSPSFGITPDTPFSFYSSERLYIEDKVITVATNAGHCTIIGIAPQADGTFKYTISSVNSFTQGYLNVGVPNNTIDTTAGYAPGLFAGVITLKCGDVYFRLREQLTNGIPSGETRHDESQPDLQVYRTFLVEDESVSDFFPSKATCIGRTHIETPEQAEIRRGSSVTYSAPFATDSTVNNLSNFNPSLFPYRDYSPQHGTVCTLMDRNESLLVMQENKCGLTPVNRELIESASGGQLVTSKNVLGTPTYYAGDYGPGKQPEGVVERFGRIYFPDVSRGVMCQLGGDGITVLSAINMESYFEGKFADVNSLAQDEKIPCGYDPENAEYVVTISKVAGTDVSVASEYGGDLSIVKKPDAGTTVKADGQVSVTYKKGGGSTWETLPEKWELISSNWEDLGNGIMYIDRLGEKGSVIMDNSLRGSTASHNIDVSTADGSLRGVGSISLLDNSISIPTTIYNQSDSASVSVTKATAAAPVTAETLSYSTKKKVWLTYYSFVPEMYAHLHNRFFSFKDGNLWRHNVSSKHSFFYGTQYAASLSVIAKANPSAVKVFDAMSVEGNMAWDAVVSTTEQSTGASTMGASSFEEKEGMWHRILARDATASSSNNTSHRIVLGQVDSIDDDKITFTSKISNLPFGIGDALYKLNVGNSTDLTNTISSVSGHKEITCASTVTGLVAGDTVTANSDDDINGDKMRDYYAKVDLSLTTVSSIELYAVNVDYTSSPLQNEQ